MGCCNNGFGGGGCLWIILLILILFCCCGNGNGSGCGCGNNCGCCWAPPRKNPPGRAASGGFFCTGGRDGIGYGRPRSSGAK